MVVSAVAIWRPWCASSLEFSDDSRQYETTFWIQTGWWEKPNLFQMREASHKIAHKLFDDLMGVYGSAQVALEACRLIVDR